MLASIRGTWQWILQGISHGPERKQLVVKLLYVIEHQMSYESVDGCKTLDLCALSRSFYHWSSLQVSVMIRQHSL